MEAEAKPAKETGEIGFIAFAWTKWHALGVEAFVERLRKDGDYRAGLVMLMPHPTEGFLVKKSDVTTLSLDGGVEVLDFPAQSGLTVGVSNHLSRHGIVFRSAMKVSRFSPVARSDVLYVVTANFIPWGALSWLDSRGLIKRFNFNIIYLDEGVGSYMPKAMFRQAFSKERTSSGMAGVRSLVQRAGEVYYDYLYAFADRLLNKSTRFLFRSLTDDAALHPNEEVVEDYRAVLSKGEKGALPGSMPDGCMALILTGPWSELGHLPLSEELALVERVVIELSAEGYGVVIKPHPREVAGKYDRLLTGSRESGYGEIALADKNVAAEKYMSFMRSCDVVAGFSSTSLVTAAALYGIKAKAISVDKLSQMSASPYMINSSREFFHKFSMFVTPM